MPGVLRLRSILDVAAHDEFHRFRKECDPQSPWRSPWLAPCRAVVAEAAEFAGGGAPLFGPAAPLDNWLAAELKAI
jgi:hypothetical protein